MLGSSMKVQPNLPEGCLIDMMDFGMNSKSSRITKVNCEVDLKGFELTWIGFVIVPEVFGPILEAFGVVVGFFARTPHCSHFGRGECRSRDEMTQTCACRNL